MYVLGLMEYAVCAKEYVRSRSTELAQRNGEWGSGGVEGVSFVVPLKDEDGVSGGVRRDGGRRARSKGPSFLVGEDDGEDARSRGRRWGRCLAGPWIGSDREL